jgi:GAF domain-containing protein
MSPDGAHHACFESPGAAEAARLEALAGYRIMDTPTEPVFDDIVHLAADLCEAPIAVVNFIAEGRQWFKAEVGIGVRELPLDVSICRHAILQPGLFVVPDLTLDPRFADNPLVTAAGGLRFYAGALIESADGLPLGTVCVLDVKPRPEGLAERQGRLLKGLAQQVMSELELRRAIAERDAEIAHARASERNLRRTQQALESLNQSLAAEVSRRSAERDRLWRLSADLLVVARTDGVITAVNPAWTTLLAGTRTSWSAGPSSTSSTRTTSAAPWPRRSGSRMAPPSRTWRTATGARTAATAGCPGRPPATRATSTASRAT